jgi:hypothetical protein
MKRAERQKSPYSDAVLHKRGFCRKRIEARNFYIRSAPRPVFAVRAANFPPRRQAAFTKRKDSASVFPRPPKKLSRAVAEIRFWNRSILTLTDMF